LEELSIVKTRLQTLLLAIVIAAAVLVAWTAYAQIRQTGSRIAWEYRDGGNMTIPQLNAYGEEGWELVAVTMYGRDHYYIFKRPK
jgi:hypothetical protein